MRNSFNNNWAFQENYTTAIQNITTDNALEFMTIRTATEHEDKRQGTDFVVELKDGTNIAARVRRPSCRYRDLTIRTYNKGHKTEIHKLKAGFGSHYLYCWTGPDWEVNEYILVNLDILRSSKLLDGAHPEMDNKDGTRFTSFSIRKLHQQGCLIRHWKRAINKEAMRQYEQSINNETTIHGAISRYQYEIKIKKELGVKN